MARDPKEPPAKKPDPLESPVSLRSGMNLDPWIDKVMGCFRVRTRVMRAKEDEPMVTGGQAEFSLDRAALTKVLIELCEHRMKTDKAAEKMTDGGIIIP